MIKFDIPSPDGGNVISLEVVRESRLARAMVKQCAHNHVIVDTSLAKLECKDCRKELNAVEWIAGYVDYWTYIKRLHDEYVEAKAAYEAKKRCRCEHCGNLTKVRPATAAEIREFRKVRDAGR